MNYGSNSKRYPLPDVLQYALEFAESSPGSRRAVWVPDDSTGSGVCADVEMRSPGLNARCVKNKLSLASLMSCLFLEHNYEFATALSTDMSPS